MVDPSRYRKSMTAIALACLLAVWGCGGAGDAGGTDAAGIERYPERPITIVTWVTPGSPTDMLARALAKAGADHFGQPIQVINRPGGSGAVAMSYLVSHPPDGYTLGIMTSSGAITMAAGQIPFHPDQFTYIQRIQLDPLMVVVRNDSPFHDLGEMYAYARENPGDLSIAGFGTTSVHFLAFSTLKSLAGDPDIPWIAYDGSSDAAVAVLGGHVDATDNNYSVVREHIRAGTMRVLGVSEPLDELPDAVTYRDQGYDVDDVHWRGVMGPAGMAPSLVAKIDELLRATVEDPEFRSFMEDSGNDYGLMASSPVFHEWVIDQVDSSRRRLEALGLLQEGSAR